MGRKSQGEPPFSPDGGLGVPVGAADERLGSLIPSLPDAVVEERVWPVLVRNPSVTQLFQLRQINSAWNRLVGTSLEWRALVFVLLDSPGYQQYVYRNRFRFLSVSQRLGLEIAHFRQVVEENMEEVENRIWFDGFKLDRLPSYVSLEGCPPCVEEDPGYYDL